MFIEQVIYQETSEWDFGVITNITSSLGSCPIGYERLNSTFYGTNHICNLGINYYEADEYCLRHL